MDSKRKKTFFRVQSSSETDQSKPLRAQQLPSGRMVISLRRETYNSAKAAAARTMSNIRHKRFGLAR